MMPTNVNIDPDVLASWYEEKALWSSFILYSKYFTMRKWKMLTFHHLDPSLSNAPNAKMSTFVAVSFTLTCWNHVWHISLFFPLFPPHCLLQIGKWEGKIIFISLSQPSALSCFEKRKKPKQNNPKSRRQRSQVHRDPYLLSVIYKLYIPFRIYIYLL